MKVNKAEIIVKEAAKKDGSTFSYLELDTGVKDVRSFRVILPEGVTLEQLPEEVEVKFNARTYETKFGPKSELYLRVIPKNYTF